LRVNLENLGYLALYLKVIISLSKYTWRFFTSSSFWILLLPYDGNDDDDTLIAVAFAAAAITIFVSSVVNLL
jgi:hypothetical protein